MASDRRASASDALVAVSDDDVIGRARSLDDRLLSDVKPQTAVSKRSRWAQLYILIILSGTVPYCLDPLPLPLPSPLPLLFVENKSCCFLRAGKI